MKIDVFLQSNAHADRNSYYSIERDFSIKNTTAALNPGSISEKLYIMNSLSSADKFPSVPKIFG